MTGGPGSSRRWWIAAVVLPLLVLGALVARQFLQGGAAALRTIVTQQQGVLVNTVLFGALTATAATALGWALAHARQLYAFRGRRLVHFAALAALVMPSFTFAMALVVLLGHNGGVAQLVGGPVVEVYGLGGLVAAGTLARLPYAYLALLLAYSHIGTRQLESARMLVASGWTTLRVVLWPRLRAPLVVAWMLVFADTVADLANPLVIGGGYGVVASRLYESVIAEGDLASATAYALLLSLPAFAYWVATTRLGVARALDAESVRRPGERPRGAGWLLVVCAWAVGLVVATLLVTVVVASVLPAAGVGLSAYAEVLAGPYTRALATTLLLALVAVPIAVALGFGAGVSSSGTPSTVRGAQRFFGFVVSIPSLVLGFGAFLALMLARQVGSGGFRVVGALVLILVVHVLSSAPLVTTAVLPGIKGLVPDRRDAALLQGATRLGLVRFVFAPRLRPAVRRSFVMAFARSLTATSSVILLADTQVPLLTARMLVEVDAGRLATASAMTVVLGGLVALVGALAQWGWRDARTD